MFGCSGFLNDADGFKTTVAQDGFNCAHGAFRLVEEDVERKRCGTGRYDDRPFPFVERVGETMWIVFHQAINDSVEEHFQLSRQVTPLTWCADDERIGFV